MAYAISDACVSCGNCVAEYPASAISKGDNQHTTDANTCINCETRVAICPTGATSEG